MSYFFGCVCFIDRFCALLPINIRDSNRILPNMCCWFVTLAILRCFGVRSRYPSMLFKIKFNHYTQNSMKIRIRRDYEVMALWPFYFWAIIVVIHPKWIDRNWKYEKKISNNTLIYISITTISFGGKCPQNRGQQFCLNFHLKLKLRNVQLLKL